MAKRDLEGNDWTFQSGVWGNRRLGSVPGTRGGAPSWRPNQVESRLDIVAEHRLAVLASTDIPRDAVSAVRGGVIAGKDRGYGAEHLRQLKGRDRGRVSFLAFDDLSTGLELLMHPNGEPLAQSTAR